MKKNYSKWFLTRVKRAIKDYEMINRGDRITVGVSGGKDSTFLLFVLAELRRQLQLDFALQPVALELGLDLDWSPLESFCRQLDLSLHVEATRIYEIVFQVRQEPNPCSLCAKLRRGALHQAALHLGCNKVALGHHLDDVLETLFLNILYTGKLGTFSPKAFLDRTGLTVIRPLVYLPQETILSASKLEKLPVIENPCPASSRTKRQEVRDMLSLLQNHYPDLKTKFLTALQNVDLENLWKQRPQDTSS
ncbi:MAG TPA: tRNA 2-thiocytidine(32) synthetase TtcA [Clostridia bacterium]|nr:tRNA 2-thiocytidine(32) synthetase TtcA [Clostridia bacterium]